MLLFRIGLYLHLSDQAADAAVILAECERHPGLHASQAHWRGRPISEHLTSFKGIRIVARSDYLAKETSSESEGATSSHTTAPETRIQMGGSKGSIQKVERKPEPPFSKEEIAQLRTRIGRTRIAELAVKFGVSQLAAAGSGAANQAGGNPDRPSVSAAISGKIALVAWGDRAIAQQAAARLEKEQKRIWEQLLGRNDQPPLLLVYANLQPNAGEETAQHFARTIHNRNFFDREGYYLRYDRSLVLRKGIADDQSHLYLGTGVHELVHALIDSDDSSIPLWLNEGLASLHEEQDATGKPMDNYRLYELLAAKKKGVPVSVSDMLAERYSHDTRLQDAMFRYALLWLFEKKGYAAVSSMYQDVRNKRGTPLLAMCGKLGIEPGKLDAAFWSFVSSRNRAAVDARWGELLPRELQDLKPRGSTPGGLNHGPIQQVPQGQQPAYPIQQTQQEFVPRNSTR